MVVIPSDNRCAAWFAADHSTVIVTCFDAMPLAMTTSSLLPVSMVEGTVKVVEPAVPGAIDMVL